MARASLTHCFFSEITILQNYFVSFILLIPVTSPGTGVWLEALIYLCPDQGFTLFTPSSLSRLIRSAMQTCCSIDITL